MNLSSFVKRAILIVFTVVVCLVVGCAAFLFSLFWPKSFSVSQTLPGGTLLTHEGTCDIWNTDSVTNSRLWLQRPQTSVELVWEGEQSERSGSCPQLVPDREAQVISSAGERFLWLGGSLYWCSGVQSGRSSATWTRWSYGEDRSLKYFGRAVMPSSFARHETLRSNWPCPSYDTPDLPPYTFRSLNENNQRLILRREEAHEEGAYPNVVYRREDSWRRWPQQICFRSQKPNQWEFDFAQTLAMNRYHLEYPIPAHLQVELLVMRIPGILTPRLTQRNAKGEDGIHYERAQSIPGARVLHRESFALRTEPRLVSLPSWWSQRKRPVALTLQGVCADPNPQLVHFQWRIGFQSAYWEIARLGEWMELRESEGSAVESPYVLICVKHQAEKKGH